jgi:hypothetical protein
MKHPWNKGEARGQITDVFGALCAMPDMVSDEGRRQAVFFDSCHGKCEMHEFRAPNRIAKGPAACGRSRLSAGLGAEDEE